MPLYFRPPRREIRKITSAMIPTTTKIPTHTPALKISPITSQLLNRNTVTNDSNVRIEKFFFMLFYLKEVYDAPQRFIAQEFSLLNKFLFQYLSQQLVCGTNKSSLPGYFPIK